MPIYRSKRNASNRKPYRMSRFKRKILAKKRTWKKVSQSKVYRFKRSDTITSRFQWGAGSTVVDTMGAQAFTLADVPGSTDFTNLFDSYRIYKVEMHFIPNGVTVLTNQSATNQQEMPVFGIAVDYDDETPAADLDTLRQYQNYKEFSFSRPFNYTVYPRATQVIFYTALLNSYAQLPRNTWLDAAYQSIPHYGIKYGVSPYTLNNNLKIGFNVTYTYHFEFKEVR